VKISIMLHTLIVLACVVFVGAFALGYHVHGSPPPAPVVQAAISHAAVAVADAAKAETVYVHDVATSTHWQTVYDTARVHDTVTVDHVVYVDRAVADSTVHACRDALSSCAVALAGKDSVIRAKDQVIAAQIADRPSRLHEILKVAAFTVGGYAVGRIGFNMRIPF